MADERAVTSHLWWWQIKLVNHKKTKRLITNEDRTVSLSIWLYFLFLFWFTLRALLWNTEKILLFSGEVHSPTSSSSKPVRSISSTYPMLRTYSRKARWQNTYWSGIWIEKALCALIHSTENSKHHRHPSHLDDVTSHLFSWCRPCRCPQTSWWRCPGCRRSLSALCRRCSAPLWAAPAGDQSRRGPWQSPARPASPAHTDTQGSVHSVSCIMN